MRIAAPFAANPIKENLIHLNDGESVGQWRDSNTGLGGSRIPYDVNTALVPAALRAIAALAQEGYFAEHPTWSTIATRYVRSEDASRLTPSMVLQLRSRCERYFKFADSYFSSYAQAWEDLTLHFFQIKVPQANAVRMVSRHELLGSNIV